MRALRRAVGSSIFDRKAYRDLFFDADATADAVLLVAAISAATYGGLIARTGLRGFSVTGLFEIVIAGLVGWLILAAATWLTATKLLGGGGQLQTMMRLHGHCELPLILAVLGPVGATIGLVWSIVAKVPATAEASSLDIAKSTAAVLVGLALVVLIRLIFRLPFLALSSLF